MLGLNLYLSAVIELSAVLPFDLTSMSIFVAPSLHLQVPDETEEKAKQSAAAPAPASPTNYTQLRSAQAMYACALSLRAAMRMLRNELTTAQADVQDGLSRVARFELQAVEGEAAAAKEKEVWEELRRDLRSCLLIKRAAIAVQKQEMQAALKDFDEAVAIDPTV